MSLFDLVFSAVVRIFWWGLVLEADDFFVSGGIEVGVAAC